MRHSRLATFGVVAVFSFMGGLAGQLVGGNGALAQSFQSFLGLRDAKNSRGWNAYVNDGQPGMIFYDENGKMRIQSGTYEGGGERGQPMFSLNDSRGEIRLLMRLAGPNDSPVLVLKDQTGRDRLVLGLSFDDKQEPFLNVTGSDGEARDIFGHYGGHP